MDFEENTVEMNDLEADDALPEEIVEEEESEEEDLAEFLDEEEPEEPEDEPEEAPAPSEPGWIKKRVAKEVEKAVARTRAEMQAMFDAQMAPIRERMIQDQAQKLVDDGKVADLETAIELVRYRQNAKPEEPKEERQRNEQGQFVSKNAESIRTEARFEVLREQAAKIKDKTGLDVIAEGYRNPEIRDAILAGEMDFYDVAEQMSKPKKRPPSPTRSPNGTNGLEGSVMNMSDAQFRRLERLLDEGKSVTLKG